MKSYFYFIVAIFLAGCTKPNVSTLPELVESADTLSDADTIFTTDNLYIQDIDVKNGRIALLCVNDNKAFVFLNKECNEIEDSIIHGSGPSDVVSGSLMKSAVIGNDNCFIITDGSTGKILNVNPSLSFTVSASINKDIIHWGEVAYGDSIFIGHENNSPELFTIVERSGVRRPVNYYLTMSDDMKKQFNPLSYDMIMRHNLALNQQKDRILAFSFFFDAVAVYSTDGKLIKTNRINNDVTGECGLIKDAGEYWLHSRPYATKDACFIKVTKVENENKTDSYMLKYNWDGDIMKVYRLPEGVTGAFAIENDSKLYCIISETKGDNELYHVVTYPLQ